MPSKHEGPASKSAIPSALTPRANSSSVRGFVRTSAGISCERTPKRVSKIFTYDLKGFFANV